MAISLVNIGTIPNDGTGDDPRTGISKVNDNFSDTTNAASKLVQTSPTDTTADRLMAVGAFGGGLLANAIDTLTTDADWEKPSGSHSFIGNSSTGVPFTGFFFATWGCRADSSDGYTVKLIDKNDGVEYVATMAAGGAPIASDWSVVYTGLNLNPNVFGGESDIDYILIGFAESSTTAGFFATISGLTEPSSITRVGTFDIVNAVGTQLFTGIIPALSGRSANKMLYMTVSSLSGLTAGEPLRLLCNSDASKITVNF